jgi:hypothetical protein
MKNTRVTVLAAASILGAALLSGWSTAQTPTGDILRGQGRFPGGRRLVQPQHRQGQ